MAAVYRLAASLSPGIGGLRSHVEFHRRGRFDATITLYDRLRAIADVTPGPDRGPPQLHPVPGPPRPGPGTCAALTATARPARAMRHALQGAGDASNRPFRRTSCTPTSTAFFWA